MTTDDTTHSPTFRHVGIVGTGAMGRGIAQIAAQSGAHVQLFDSAAGAAERAQTALFAQWEKLAVKGKVTADQVAQYRDRTTVAASLQGLSTCDLKPCSKR